MSLTARLQIGKPPGRAFQRVVLGRVARAAAYATDEAARQAHFNITGAMGAMKLGKLARAIGHGSDLKKRRVPPPNARFRVSGWVFARTKSSERTAGALKAYTEGATIVPRKGRWLWIATDEIPQKVGRHRMTPQRYINSGLERRIGELEFIPGDHAGEALLIARDVTVNAATGYGKARRAPRRGAIGATRKKVDFIVAFIGIKITRRSARVDPLKLTADVARRVPTLMLRHLTRTAGRQTPGKVVGSLGTRFSL